MRLLDLFFATPVATAVGWTLLHSLWQGALLATALAAAMVVLQSSRMRYAAACVAMLAMLSVTSQLVRF